MTPIFNYSTSASTVFKGIKADFFFLLSETRVNCACCSTTEENVMFSSNLHSNILWRPL